MSPLLRSILLISAIAILAIGSADAATTSDEARPVAIAGTTPVPASPDAVAYPVLEVPTPTCYHALEGPGLCYIEWSYVSATASTSQYLISVSLQIAGSVRAQAAGFFQTSLYLPSSFFEPGLRVACGWLGKGGDSTLGNQYSWMVTAKETGGAVNALSGTVLCPTGQLFRDGFERGDTSAWSAHVP